MSKILSNKSNVDLDYPICRPSLDLDFTQEVLDERITFSRGSIGTRVNRNRLIETVPANQPRFDYDPVTGECKGLLIEESRQNYELNSGDPTQWASNQNMTLTGNSIVLPDGTTSTNVEFRGTDSGANVKILRPGPSGAGVAAGETWTFSIFLRAGTERTVQIAMQTQTGGDSITRNFNLVTGQWTGTLGGTNAANGSSGYQYFGNGWYRVWLINTYQGSSSGQQTILRLRANTTQMQMTTSFSAWGAQLEKGAFPTSYIPTTTSSVTRSDDLASMTGNNFSSWYNQTEGTIFVDCSNPAVSTMLGSVSLNDTNTNRIQLESGTNTRAIRNVYNGVIQTSSLSYSYNTRQKFIVSYNSISNILNFSNSGSLGTPIRSQGISTMNVLRIGASPGGSNNLNSSIARLTYYPRALKPNQLQLLTA